MKKILVVIDMQNDFVDGSLGTKEALSIVPKVVKKINEFDGDEIFVTYDTHHENYLNTLEGEKLPIVHCIEGTHGHRLNAEVKKALTGRNCFEILKAGFGSFSITRGLKERYPGEEMQFELVGLCTDVCVVSNALIIRAGYPNARIAVDASCCAGITPETHRAALTTMKSCQIDIIE